MESLTSIEIEMVVDGKRLCVTQCVDSILLKYFKFDHLNHIDQLMAERLCRYLNENFVGESLWKQT